MIRTCPLHKLRRSMLSNSAGYRTATPAPPTLQVDFELKGTPPRPGLQGRTVIRHHGGPGVGVVNLAGWRTVGRLLICIPIDKIRVCRSM
jgi:hypothetical protein